MSIGRGQATVVTELDMISKVGSAFKKTEHRCAGAAWPRVHAGHIAWLRSQAIRGAVGCELPEDEDDLNVAHGVRGCHLAVHG